MQPKIKVTCLGHGGAFSPLAIGNTSFLIEVDHNKILVDCGTTVPEVLKEMGVDPGDLTACFITHLHADHVGGLERLLYHRAYISRSAFPLQLVMGPTTMQDWREMTRIAKNDLLRHVNLRSGMGIDDVHTRVTWYSTNHGGDIGGMSCYSLKINIDGKSIFFSGDRIWHCPNAEHIRRAMHSADLSFHELETFTPGSGVHTNIRDVSAADIRSQIWWVHHGMALSEPTTHGGFQLAVKGQQWEL